MATNPTTVSTILDDEREWASYVSCLGLRCDLLCILKLSCIVLAINNLIYELFLMTLMTYTGCLIFFEKKQPSWLNETFSSCSNLESFSRWSCNALRILWSSSLSPFQWLLFINHLLCLFKCHYLHRVTDVDEGKEKNN